MAVTLDDTLNGVLSAVSSALTEEGRPAGTVHLGPGLQQAWQDCCKGQLWVRVIEAFPTAGPGVPFPGFDSQQRGGCAPALLAVHIGVGIMRCAHTIDDNGKHPTAAELTEDANETFDDLATMLRVLTCTAPGLPGVAGFKLGRWTPQGVLGGCVGGEWDAYVGWNPCIDCEDS